MLVKRCIERSGGREVNENRKETETELSKKNENLLLKQSGMHVQREGKRECTKNHFDDFSGMYKFGAFV